MANVKKKSKVVMLSTEKAKLYLDGGKLYWNPSTMQIPVKPQPKNLYILSDEEIKKGDWITDGIKVMQASSKIVNAQHLIDRRDWKKIIATTDASLLLDFNKEGDGGFINFPQPSKQFIEKYIESYNNGNIITEVMVEYEPFRITIHTGKRYEEKLKINPKDNTITISKCKDSWTREERNEDVIKALLSNDLIHSREEALQWIEENL